MPSAPECDAHFLRFKDAGVEQAFLASRHVNVAKRVFFGYSLILLYLLVLGVIVLFRDWSTTGHMFASTSEGRRLSELRNGLSIVLAALAVVLIVTARLSLAKRGFGPRGFEVFICCSECLGAVLLTVSHPWYLARIREASDPWKHITDPFLSTDDGLLLNLDIWLTLCHFLIPIRWISLWPLQVAVVLCYAVPALVLPSHLEVASVVPNIVKMILLVVAAAWAQRALEMHERLAFAQLAKERTLRAEAEHKLSRAEEELQQGKTRPVDMDAASLPTTTHTGELFAMGGSDATVESQLDSIVKLGVQEHWIIKQEALQPLHDKILGTGGFGIAMVARFHGAEVVLKASRLSKDRAMKKTLLAASGELRIFRRLHHPNIVGFYGACIDSASSEIVLVLEYIRGKELHEAIEGVPSDPHALVDRCILVDNICSALMYLHAQTPVIIHGDIKSSNVLVEQLPTGRKAKLVDFGLSRLLTRRTQNLGGTLSWMAPEVIRKENSAKAPSADVFSFGRLMFLILTGRMPLMGVSREDIIEAAWGNIHLDLDWPESTQLLAEARAVCEACLEVDPTKRVSIAEAQESLHQLGSSFILRGSAATMLRQTFPQQAGSSSTLHQVLEKARSMRLPSNYLARRETRDRTERRQQPGTGAPRLLAPQFEPTPDTSKLMSLAIVMAAWNIPICGTQCCSKHALVQDLQRLALEMQEHACTQAGTHAGLQCSRCKLIGFVERGDASACEMCPPSWSGTRSRLHETLESVSEAPAEEIEVAAGERTVARL